MNISVSVWRPSYQPLYKRLQLPYQCEKQLNFACRKQTFNDGLHKC